MKRIYNSLYGKISLVFLLILLVLGIAQTYITIDSCVRLIDEARHRMNVPLAGNIAGEFEMYFTEGRPAGSIEQSVEGMMMINPEIEIYLLDSQGKILRSFMRPGHVAHLAMVNMAPIEQFLKNPNDIQCVGDDPCQPGRQKIFSAAPINYTPRQAGFVYVVQGAEAYHSALTMVLDSHIGRSAIQVLVITLVFTGLAGILLFRMLTRRFQSMTQTLTRFTAGDLAQRITVHSDDEVGQLARAFNQMANTITLNMAEISAKDQHRRELIANISHDLRSPLASIQGYLETILIRGEKMGGEQRQRILQTIFKNASQLSGLVGELFELSKLDARQVQPDLEPFSVAELAQDVTLKFKPRADEHQISLRLMSAENIPLVKGDIGMIERILTNLIDNALNYTPTEGVVTVELSLQDNSVQVKVADTGPGIPADDIPHIFDRFYRVEKSRSRQTQPSGTGLGLAIAKKLIELNNSDIIVKSALNQGTAFVFHLPVVN